MAFRIVRYTGADEHPEHPRYGMMYGPVHMALIGATDLAIPAEELRIAWNGMPSPTRWPFAYGVATALP